MIRIGWSLRVQRMQRKLLAGLVSIMLVNRMISSTIEEDEERKHQCFSVVQIGTEITSVYRNGRNFTGEYRILVQKAKEKVAKYFGKDICEVKFENYCMLEMNGITIETMYTVNN